MGITHTEREDNELAGNRQGGLRAAQTNKERYGNTFYSDIGSEGGKKGTTGGTYNNPELARRIGAIGGKRSRRGHTLIKVTKEYLEYIDNITKEVVRYTHDRTLVNHKRNTKV